MPEGKFDQFTDLSHLFAAATDVVIADFVEVCFLVFALDRIALCTTSLAEDSSNMRGKYCTCVDYGILRDYAVLRGIGVDYFELHRPHTTTNQESVALADRTVRCSGVNSQRYVGD